MNPITIPIPAVGFHPPVYHCRRADRPFCLDGRLDKPFWKKAPYTDAFLDIEGAHMPLPRFVTRAKMLWDDENLYIGAELDGNEIWGHITQRDAVIFYDNDFEIFIDPDSDTQQYYEYEMNVLNTVWDLFLPIAYRDGGSALNGFDLHGLQTAVHVEGTINDPCADNRRWSAEVVIPFAAITETHNKRAPRNGEFYRLNFSRVQWKVDIEDNAYKKRCTAEGNPLPEDNWVWAPTGVINIHYPELWGFLFFADNDEEQFAIPEDEHIKWELRKLYYAQQIHRDLHGCYTDSLEILKAILAEHAPNEYNRTVADLDYRLEKTSHTFELSCPAADGVRRAVIYFNGKAVIR